MLCRIYSKSVPSLDGVRVELGSGQVWVKHGTSRGEVGLEGVRGVVLVGGDF